MSEDTTEQHGTDPENTDSTPTTEPVADAKSFTQEDIDRIVSERVKRVEAKFSDYSTLKQQVEEFDSALAAARTEAINEANAAFAKEKAIHAIALEAKGRFADTEDALLNLRERADDFITEGSVNTEAVTAAIDDLLEAKPHLGVSKSIPPAPHDVGLGQSGGSKPPASNAQKFADFFNEQLSN